MKKDFMLYHGTSESFARKILAEGLKPRGVTGNNNWTHEGVIESNPAMIYLTTTYAPYFASNVVKEGERLAILEIDGNLLRPEGFYPDEDFIVECLKREKKDIDAKKVRDNLRQYKKHWRLSLEKLGNCCYARPIPVTAIRRVVFIDYKKNPTVFGWSLDPSISCVNFRLCGHQYQAINQWYFGKQYTAEEWLKIKYSIGNTPISSEDVIAMLPPNTYEQNIKILTEILSNRKGIEIVNLSA